MQTQVKMFYTVWDHKGNVLSPHEIIIHKHAHMSRWPTILWLGWTVPKARVITYVDDVLLSPSCPWRYRSWLTSNTSSRRMLDLTSTCPRPPSSPRVSHNMISPSLHSVLMVEKVDVIQDDFIHYQLLRFFQSTRLHWYINSHIFLGNRCVLHQQYVDCKIDDTLLKKDTNQHTDGWDTSSKTWTHMVLHLPHPDGGFGVTFNDVTDVTKDVTFYTTTSRFVVWLGVFSQERQKLWLSQDDLQDSVSWSSSPLVLFRDIHKNLLPTMMTGTLYPLSLILTREFVLVTSNRTVMHSHSRLPLSYFHDNTWKISSRPLQSRNVPRRVLWFKPMSWLGQIRPHHRDES